MLFLSRLVVVFIPDSSGVLILLLVEEGGDSVLSPELLPCLFREVVDHLSSESDAGHGVQNRLVGEHRTELQHLTIQTRLNPVHLRAFPDASSNHGRADVDEHRPGEAADELLNDV